MQKVMPGDNTVLVIDDYYVCLKSIVGWYTPKEGELYVYLNGGHTCKIRTDAKTWDTHLKKLESFFNFE